MRRLADAVAPGRIALVMRRAELDTEALSSWQSHPSAGSLAELLADEADLAASISVDLLPHLQELAPRLSAELPECGTALVILIPHQQAPAGQPRCDGEVDSFLCSASLLRSIQDGNGDPCLSKLCFRLLSKIADGDLTVDTLLVRQLPCAPVPMDASDDSPIALLMPHRGRLRHLEVALRYIANNRGPRVKVRVGLDVDDPAGYEKLCGESTELYLATPAPCGPYLIRQWMACRSLEPMLVWHDSDDLSTSDRMQTLRSELISSGCDLAGSHELRLDQRDGKVEAWRYPLDVSGTLARGPGDPVLFGTCMIRRDAFHRSGGLSTDQRFGSDTQFLLRAWFLMKMRNVDAFLYIRRRHAESLTESPETGMSVPLRRQWARKWHADFRAVQAGQLQLDQSSLGPIVSRRDVRLERFPVAPPVVVARGKWWYGIRAMVRRADSPQATIVMPLRKQNDEWLEKSVKSAVRQSAPVEVIVVTAESTPAGNLTVLADLSARYRNLQVVVRDKPESFPGAINTGIRAASTDRIGLLFSDDWLHRDTVRHCLGESADIVSTGNRVYDAAEVACAEVSRIPTLKAYQTRTTLHAKAAYLKHFFLFRRAMLLQVGGLDETIGNYPGIDDFDLIWTLLEHGATVSIVEKPLYQIRDHEGDRLTLADPATAIRNYARILRKHGVSDEEARELISDSSAWYGKTIREAARAIRSR